jgi:hypothetical protein
MLLADPSGARRTAAKGATALCCAPAAAAAAVAWLLLRPVALQNTDSRTDMVGAAGQHTQNRDESC